jgi:PAS domain-containing protein
VALEAVAALGLPALAGILVGTDDGFFDGDERNRFTYANPAACQMLGRSLDPSRGHREASAFELPDLSRGGVHRAPRRAGHRTGGSPPSPQPR